MYCYRRLGLHLAEEWFVPPAITNLRADILVVRRAEVPIIGAKVIESLTLLTALNEDEAGLWQRLSRENRYEVRRAETKDNFVVSFLDKPDRLQVLSFIEFYNMFAKQKGMAALTGCSLEAIQHWQAGDNLLLTRVDRELEPLVWHAYYAAGNRCRLLFSASHFRGGDAAMRSLIGRANRFLHWRDLMEFKRRGFISYDWGGWHAGAENDLVRINHFKEGFGGDRRTLYDSKLGISWLGRLAVAVDGWRSRRSETLNREECGLSSGS